MRKIAHFALAAVALSPIFAFAQISDHLVISQVQITGGSGKTSYDFVEIYNPTAADIDLDGIRLVKRTKIGITDTLIKSWTASTIVKAYSYYLWANSDFTSIAVVADVTTTGSIAADNGVALRMGANDTGTIIDSVGWGEAGNAFVEATVFATNPDDNQSLIRKPADATGNGEDTNNNSADFILQATALPRNSQTAPTQIVVPTPSPQPSPVPPPPAPSPVPVPTPSPSPTPPPPPSGGSGGAISYSSAIIISEFLPNPDGPDSGEEWIELFNNSSEIVDLNGWKLDDEGKDGAVGSTAYTFPANSTVMPNSYFVVNLPEGSFALNNTGGDTLRLVWPNGILATKQIYSQTAKEDLAWAIKKDSSFAWTTLVTKGLPNEFDIEAAKPTSSKNTVENNPAAKTSNAELSVAESKVKISEIFPNPKGSDTGFEWVELINTGTTPIYIHEWILDDGEKEEKIGSNAWTIESPTIQPGGVAVLMIPAGKFALNNSGKETVRIFAPNKVLVDSVTFDGSKEDLSYSLVDGKWVWTKPTPEAVNVLSIAPISTSYKIIINEILPEPESGSEEFIELYNNSNNEVDLTGWTLLDNANTYKLPKVTIATNGFYVVKKTDSKLALNNFGAEIIKITDKDGKVVAEIEYEDAPKNQSLNFIDFEYVWSAHFTPGEKNVISDGESVRVLGASLPRTGLPLQSLFDFFVLFFVFCYILSKLTMKKHYNE